MPKIYYFRKVELQFLLVQSVWQNFLQLKKAMNFDGVMAPLAYFMQQYLDYEANDNQLDDKFQQPAYSTQ